MVRFVSILALTFLLASSSHGKRVSAEIGQFRNGSGGIGVSIEDVDGQRSAMLHVFDEYVVDSVMFFLSKGELTEIRNLLDEAIGEL